MEIIKPPKQIFMAGIERREPASRDHTAVISAKTCLRKYFYEMVLGFTDKITPQFFKFGTAYHKFREVLETSTQETEQKQYSLEVV